MVYILVFLYHFWYNVFMIKNYCRHCKKEFKNIDLRCDYISTSGRKFYTCLPCNTLRAKKYRKTKNGKEKIYKAVYKSIDKFKYKQNARIYLNEYLKLGKIHKPILCEKCNKETQLFGHHEDYSKPLEVIWLCRSCHSNLHKKVV